MSFLFELSGTKERRDYLISCFKTLFSTLRKGKNPFGPLSIFAVPSADNSVCWSVPSVFGFFDLFCKCSGVNFNFSDFLLEGRESGDSNFLFFEGLSSAE